MYRDVNPPGSLQTSTLSERRVSRRGILASLSWQAMVIGRTTLSNTGNFQGPDGTQNGLLRRCSCGRVPEPDGVSHGLLSGENATARTQFEWPSSIYSAAPVAESQSMTVLSHDADATSLPSGENATPQILSKWPSSVCSAAPVAASQSLTVLSCDADSLIPASDISVCPTKPTKRFGPTTLFQLPLSINSGLWQSVYPHRMCL